MKERPILFSGEMVRAILDGRKTQTRRIYKGATIKDSIKIITSGWFNDFGVKCPFGQAGDRLWVKETHRFFCHSFEFVGIEYASGGADKLEHFEDRTLMPSLREIAKNNKDGSRRWKPSIFMRRWASRITLEIVSVRVERLQAISLEDAKAEGVETTDQYADLWLKINGEESWYSNPFVWVIEFKRVEGGAK